MSLPQTAPLPPCASETSNFKGWGVAQGEEIKALETWKEKGNGTERRIPLGCTRPLPRIRQAAGTLFARGNQGMDPTGRDTFPPLLLL